MDVSIYPPPGSVSPWVNRWYGINVIEVKFDLSATINEHPIIDKNTFLFSQYKHSTSAINIDCILTADSDIQGTGIEDKKNNLIDAAVMWWSYDDAKIKTNCAQIRWRGWVQYVMIEKIDFDKIGGDEIEYLYTLRCIIHEGQS